MNAAAQLTLRHASEFGIPGALDENGARDGLGRGADSGSATKAESEAVRVAAIKEIFDCGFGKATQPVEGLQTYGVSEQPADLFKGQRRYAGCGNYSVVRCRHRMASGPLVRRMVPVELAECIREYAKKFQLVPVVKQPKHSRTN